MFAYSFLAMTAYNIVKPLTRSNFISSLGADNLPYAQLAAGGVIAALMVAYAWLVSRLPRRWCLPITQGLLAALLFAFWFLFHLPSDWVSVAFYLFGLILGALLISQFWTVASVVYDARQARRLFGFIGGGAPLGGIAGSLLLTRLANRIPIISFLLISGAMMLASVAIVVAILRCEPAAEEATEALAAEGKGIGWHRAIELLSGSRHLQVIAVVISLAAFGAVIIEQQLNMAAEAFKGQEATDSITVFLGQVQLWTSVIGFIIQIWLTSRIHRYLGIGFALLLLPMGLLVTAVIMLAEAALWAPALARILDQSMRYTVDKTTREILYMPLPAKAKLEAKSFVDVTVDRFARGLAAVLVLFLIKPWGLGLNWQQLSYGSVLITGVWLLMAHRATGAYQTAFRQSLESRDMKPGDIGPVVADPSTLEALIQELASPDERRVLYAIDILDALDKRHLVTPLLLYHEAPAVRARALALLGCASEQTSSRWLHVIQRMIGDEDPQVRVAAVGALAGLRHKEAADLVRPLLRDPNPRIALTAALVLAGSEREEDMLAAEQKLTRLVAHAEGSSAEVRRDFAVALRQARVPHCRRLLIPLLHSDDPEVADEAMRTIRYLLTNDFIFVPTLVSLLGHRRLKSSAREILVGYGEDVLAVLAYFLRDPQEQIWIRRHIPATIARIPCQKSMDTLIDSLEERDAFLRFKIVAGIERLRRTRPELDFRRRPVERLALREAAQWSRYLALERQAAGLLPSHSFAAGALAQKTARSLDRIYRLLSILYPWRDIAAARWQIEHGASRIQAAALEYLDNILSGELRKVLIPLLEEAHRAEGGSGASFGRGGRIHSEEKILASLLNDADQEISAAAAHLIQQEKITALEGELEGLLARRDPQDRCAWEAANFALTSLRLPPGARGIYQCERLPAVGLAERLRRLPLFSSVAVDELFRIAEAGRQVHYESGRILYEEGRVPAGLRFLLHGCLVCRAPTGHARYVEPPVALGFFEVVQGKPMRENWQTSEPSICLELS
jgi:AAA family ATP:ADP antiporter